MKRKKSKKAQKKSLFQNLISINNKGPRFYFKNLTLFLNTLVMAFLGCITAVFFYHRSLLNTSFIRLSEYKVFLLIIDFVFILFFIWLNYKILFPIVINKINKQLFRLKSKPVSYLFTFIVFIVSLFLFQNWNIDLIFLTHKVKLSSLFIENRNELSFENKNEIDFSGLAFNDIPRQIIGKTDYNTAYGRFLRTYRWDQYIKRIEQKYNIEPYLLAGLIMQESYGNPLQLNSRNDGGAGLMMFQPGTAKAYGLKVYGNSNKTGRDIAHGLALRKLMEAENFNYTRLSNLDERFDVSKSMNAGARFLAELYQKHKSWDKAISAYNRGKPAIAPKTTQHVRMVRYFQQQYKQNLNNVPSLNQK